MVPLTSIMIIEAIHYSMTPLIQLSFILWGIGMMLMRVCSLPFIIRHTTNDNSTEALSLSASTWSLSTMVSGLIISGLDLISKIKLSPELIKLDEYGILWAITLIGSLSYVFTSKINEDADFNRGKRPGIFSLHKTYDWSMIFKAISPLILISIGAGLTIPFVNLFFNSVFHFNWDNLLG